MQTENLRPHCDMHPETEMRLNEVRLLDPGGTHKDIDAFCCTKCNRWYEPFWGWGHLTGSGAKLFDSRRESVQCHEHASSAAVYMFLEQQPDGSFRFACPIVGCEQTLPFEPIAEKE